MPRLLKKTEDRFWEKVDRTSGGFSGCWVWKSYKDPLGYGRLSVNGVFQYAHRYSYILNFGDIPTLDGKTLSICHKCGNPACVNPSHLYAGTHSDNARDSIVAGTFVSKIAEKNREKTHCPKGHRLDSDNLVKYKVKIGERECLICRRASSRKYYNMAAAASESK